MSTLRPNTWYVALPQTVLTQALSTFTNWGVDIQNTPIANINTWGVMWCSVPGGPWELYRAAEIDKGDFNFNNPRRNAFQNAGGVIFTDRDNFLTWYKSGWGTAEQNNDENYPDDPQFDPVTFLTIVRP